MTRDLARPENTVRATPSDPPGIVQGLRQARPGDIILLGFQRYHAQVVTRVGPDGATIIQGDAAMEGCGRRGVTRLVRTLRYSYSEPSTPCYAGTPLKVATNDLEMNHYHRVGYEASGMEVFEPGSVVWRWNFDAFG